MGAFFEEIPESQIKWILEQKLFYVATAPLSAKGHINVSPKGGPYFGVDNPRTFWYQELTGSGSETMSHLYENGRITIMLTAFTGPPRILRLWGHGTVLEHGTPAFSAFVASHPSITTIPGTRSIIKVDIHQVGTSCGFSVPYFDFVGHRDILNEHFRKKDARFRAGKEGESMPRYWAYKNAWSMDGLPAMKTGLEAAREHGVKPIRKMVGRAGEELAYASNKYGGGRKVASLEQLLLVALVCLLMGALAAVQGPALVGRLQAVAREAPRPSLMAWSG
ncbi:uncharacterized protein HMPREF1541_01171 [Cyphellophora europaea CBS 101466]|uniref:Uncharacterized protein n=1 Tax=Cyphellophora europaea (strain CBS 101466) TaxID=1220924 RepID=W2SE31_CYPE1|nr:uncharacterized protein HMPREF1541_01171 [Cyphellophora europaea CBS 101466]ETN46981.1 hypothetical protein HMPREF1541_01171 [Cyphellophora europaea CBS 101466]